MSNDEDAYTKKLKSTMEPSEEVERLKYQAKLLFDKEKEIFNLLGVQDGISILEIGSGPGFISELLLESYPNSNLTCVEVNPELVAIAKQNLVNKNLKILNESILECSLPEASFDIVYARVVLMHIPNAPRAVEAIFRLLKPGGLFIVSEAEDQFFVLEPDIGELYQKLIKIAHDTQLQLGGDRAIGRKMPKILKDSGFEDLKINCVVIHSHIDSAELIKKVVDLSEVKSLLEMNLISKEEFSFLESYIESFPVDENSFGMIGLLLISGKKPET